MFTLEGALNAVLAIIMTGVLFGPLLFILIQFISINDLSTEGKYVLGTASWMAIWWVLEVVDIAVTSLLPIVIFPRIESRR